MKTRMLLQTSVLCFIVSAGCGEESPRLAAPPAAKAADKTPPPNGQPSLKLEGANTGATTVSGGTLVASGTVALSGSSLTIAGGGAAAPNESVERKIIQTATLDVLVSDFDKSRLELTKMIGDCKGYIVKSEFNGNIGAKRTGTWTVRVPVDRFQAFVNDVLALGQPQRNLTEAQDVTEEYVDLQADVKNLKNKEAKLNDLMKDQAKTMSDVYLWEKEIYNVKGEIGRKEARTLALNKLTSMSTINITLRDEKEYVAPAVPALGTSVPRTFQASWDALQDFGHFLLVVLVALAPWSPLLLVFILLAYKFRNVRIGGGHKSRPAEPEELSPPGEMPTA